jgi:hypothetical protein
MLSDERSLIYVIRERSCFLRFPFVIGDGSQGSSWLVGCFSEDLLDRSLRLFAWLLLRLQCKERFLVRRPSELCSLREMGSPSSCGCLLEAVTNDTCTSGYAEWPNVDRAPWLLQAELGLAYWPSLSCCSGTSSGLSHAL